MGLLAVEKAAGATTVSEDWNGICPDVIISRLTIFGLNSLFFSIRIERDTLLCTIEERINKYETHSPASGNCLAFAGFRRSLWASGFRQQC
jgi:hypothetical protein